MAKLLIYVGIFVGGIVGAYLPVLLFHANPLGAISIICSGIGSLVGLVLGIKLYNITEY